MRRMKFDRFLQSRTPEQRRDFYARLWKIVRKRKGLGKVDDVSEFRYRTAHRIYVHAISRGRKRPGSQLALDIEAVTDGMVRRWELRSDIWKEPARRKAANGTAKPARKRASAVL